MYISHVEDQNRKMTVSCGGDWGRLEVDIRSTTLSKNVIQPLVGRTGEPQFFSEDGGTPGCVNCFGWREAPGLIHNIYGGTRA